MIYRKPVPDQVEIGFWIMVEHQTSGTFVLVVGRELIQRRKAPKSTKPAIASRVFNMICFANHLHMLHITLVCVRTVAIFPVLFHYLFVGKYIS